MPELTSWQAVAPVGDGAGGLGMGDRVEMQVYGEGWKKGAPAMLSEKPQDLRLMG